MRVLKSLGGSAGFRADEVVKGGRVLDTRAQILQVPQVTEGLEHGGSTVCGGLAGDGVSTVALNVTLGGVRREQPSGDTTTETVEAESVRAAIIRGLSVGLVIGANGQRGSDVVEESTGLVEGDKEEGLLPLRASADGIVDLLQENFTEGNVAGGVHGVGVKATAGGVNVGKLGEEAQVGVLVEVLDRDDVALGVFGGPVEEHGIRKEGAVGAVVVEPRDPLLGGSLEDAGGGDGGGVEVLIILAVAIGDTRHRAETVGVGGLVDGQFDIFGWFATWTVLTPGTQECQLLKVVNSSTMSTIVGI